MQPFAQFWLETSAVGNQTVDPVKSTKKPFTTFMSLEAKPNWGNLDRNDEAGRNTNYDGVPHQVDGAKPTLEIETRMYPDTLGFWLAATGGLGASVYTGTAGDGIITDLIGGIIPVGVRRNRWVMPMNKSGAYPQSIGGYIGHPGEGNFYEVRGCSVKNIDFGTPDEGGATLTISLECTFIQEIVDPALTPAAEALSVKAMTKHGFSVPTWNGGAAIKSLGAKLELPVESEHYVSGGESHFPTTTQYSEDGISQLTFEIEKPVIDSADWQSAINGTPFEGVASWSSPTVAAAGYRYRFTIKAPQVQLDPEGATTGRLGNKRRTGVTYPCTASTDGTVPSATFEVCNTTASYA